MTKRLALFFILLAGFLQPAISQNNDYDIDDECFEYMKQAEALIGKPGFDEVNAKLLARAKAKGDEKARTIYYVECLKHVTKLRPTISKAEDPRAYEKEMMRIEQDIKKAFEELKIVSRETGYKQYYYYAYQLIRNYYFTTRQYSAMMDTILEMRETAIQEGDEYGKWTSDKYMVSMYLTYDDYKNAKRYLKEVLGIYETSEDETILRQSVAHTYLEYAECFPVGSDSMRLMVAKSAEVNNGLQDTCRRNVYLATFALLDRDIKSYKSYRDEALSSQYGSVVSKTLPIYFKLTDAVVDGSIDKYGSSLDSLSTHKEIMMLEAVAESWGHNKTALILEKALTGRMREKIANLNEISLSELEVQYGNKVLQAELDASEERVERITRILIILGAVILAGLIVFLLLHIRTLRRAKRNDEKRITELTEANERVRFANEAKTRFIQNMTHEVRTPLNAITGFSQLLSLPDGMFSEEEKAEFSSHVMTNTKMLTMLLDDILHSSDMDSGTYSITIEECECGAICHESISSAEHRLQPGVQIHFLPEIELPFTLKTDPLRVQQVLTNLLTNACKHTPSGEIRLGCSLSEDKEMLTFTIEDTGSGIPAEDAERIFDRFVKLNDFVQGTGLGLSICRDITTRLGGKIYLDTSYTGGSRFVFSIPVKK